MTGIFNIDLWISNTVQLAGFLGFYLEMAVFWVKVRRFFLFFWIYGVRGVLVISYKRVVWEFQMRVEVVKDLQAF